MSTSGRRPVKTKFVIKPGRERAGAYGGTYRLDDVLVGDRKVGTIQVQMKSGRVASEPVVTCMPNGVGVNDGCVVGYHPEWLVRSAGFAGARRRRR